MYLESAINVRVLCMVTEYNAPIAPEFCIELKISSDKMHSRIIRISLLRNKDEKHEPVCCCQVSLDVCYMPSI